jgi:hypothetical protein
MRNATTVLESKEAKDASRTLLNRARLGANKNLPIWYRELARVIFNRPRHQSSVSRFCAALLPFSEQHEATATIN